MNPETKDALDKPEKNSCGSYFCMHCGDCINCYGDLDCIDGGFHEYPPGADGTELKELLNE